MLKPMRYFRNYFQCDACPNEWSDDMLVVGPSWCPCCDGSVEPYSSEQLFDLTDYDEEEEALG